MDVKLETESPILDHQDSFLQFCTFTISLHTGEFAVEGLSWAEYSDVNNQWTIFLFLKIPCFFFKEKNYWKHLRCGYGEGWSM